MSRRYEDTFSNLCLFSLGRRRGGGLTHILKSQPPLELLFKAISESIFENLYLGRRRGGHRLGRSTGSVLYLVGHVFRDRFFDKAEKVTCGRLELRLRLVSDFLRLLLCFLSVFWQFDVLDVRQLDVLDIQRGEPLCARLDYLGPRRRRRRLRLLPWKLACMILVE